MKLTTILAALCIAVFGFAIGRDTARAPVPVPASAVPEAVVTIKVPQPALRRLSIIATGVTKDAAFVAAVGRAAALTPEYRQLSAEYLDGVGGDGAGNPLHYWVCRLTVEMPKGYEDGLPLRLTVEPTKTPGI